MSTSLNPRFRIDANVFDRVFHNGLSISGDAVRLEIRR